MLQSFAGTYWSVHVTILPYLRTQFDFFLEANWKAEIQNGES